MGKLRYLFVAGLSAVSALAQEAPTFEEATASVPGLQGLIELVRPVFIKFSVLVGGIFGLYFLLLLVRVYYERKKVKLLKDIRYDLDKLNMHHGIPYSRAKKGIVRRGLGFVREKLFSPKMVPLNKKHRRRRKK